MLQCPDQSCGSSGSQIIVSEAAVGYNQTNTLELDQHVSVAMEMITPIPPEEPIILHVTMHDSNLVYHTVQLTHFQ